MVLWTPSRAAQLQTSLYRRATSGPAAGPTQPAPACWTSGVWPRGDHQTRNVTQPAYPPWQLLPPVPLLWCSRAHPEHAPLHNTAQRNLISQARPDLLYTPAPAASVRPLCYYSQTTITVPHATSDLGSCPHRFLISENHHLDSLPSLPFPPCPDIQTCC